MSEILGNHVFTRKTYNEAMSLLVDARNYIAYRQSHDVEGLGGDVRLLVSQETMRITCRLTQAMAWLLCRRAVEAGELTDEQALGDEYAIGGESVCFEDSWADDERLPPGVRDLLSRTFHLYTRVHRLDDMLRGQSNQPIIANAQKGLSVWRPQSS